VTTIGVLHPGDMGAAIGASLRSRGFGVHWASADRGAGTVRRAADAGLQDVGTLARLCAESDIVLSICPPHAAIDVAKSVAAQGFSGVYVDANAVSPATAAEVAALVAPAHYVDGGVIGPPPTESAPSRLYLSGDRAGELAGILGGGPLEAIAIDGGPTAASALKMTYAAWTKGTAAMLLAVRETAAANGVLEALLAEWSRSQPALADRLAGAERSAATKGWRWTGEMREIAATFHDAGQPAGFHQAAAAIYETYDRPVD